MNIGEYIKSYIKDKGRTSLWISEKLGMNYKTFVGKLNRNSLTADELLKISALIDMNLEEMKYDLEYYDLFKEANNFVYVPINVDNNNDIFSSEEIYVEKMELMNKKCKDKNVLVGVLGDDDINNFNDINKYTDIKIYAFVKSENEENQYRFEEVSVNYLKDVEGDEIPIKSYMVKSEKNPELYELVEKRYIEKVQVQSSRGVRNYYISSKEMK